MAMYITDGTEIEGKVGGTIFRSDRCGTHVESAGRYINREPTDKQIARRISFSKLVGYLRVWATFEFVGAWQDYANLHPRKNRKGKWYYLTWWQEFISYNLNNTIAGQIPQRWPPGYIPIGE